MDEQANGIPVSGGVTQMLCCEHARWSPGELLRAHGLRRHGERALGQSP